MLECGIQFKLVQDMKEQFAAICTVAENIPLEAKRDLEVQLQRRRGYGALRIICKSGPAGDSPAS